MILYRYSIDTLSIYRDRDRDLDGDRDRDRDKTEKKTKTKKKTFYAKTKKSAAHSPQGSFALEGVKASRSRSKKRNGQHPNPSPDGWAFRVSENGHAIYRYYGSNLVSMKVER